MGMDAFFQRIFCSLPRRCTLWGLFHRFLALLAFKAWNFAYPKLTEKSIFRIRGKAQFPWLMSTFKPNLSVPSDLKKIPNNFRVYSKMFKRIFEYTLKFSNHNIPKFFQVHLETKVYEIKKHRTRVLPFHKFCEWLQVNLPKI